MEHQDGSPGQPEQIGQHLGKDDTAEQVAAVGMTSQAMSDNNVNTSKVSNTGRNAKESMKSIKSPHSSKDEKSQTRKSQHIKFEDSADKKNKKPRTRPMTAEEKVLNKKKQGKS